MNKRIYPRDIKNAVAVPVIMLSIFFILIILFITTEQKSDSFELMMLMYFAITVLGLYNLSVAYVEFNEDEVLLVKGLRRWRIKYDQIELVALGYYAERFSSNQMPALFVVAEGLKKPAYIFHRRYGEDRVVEIVERLYTENSRIELCENIQALLENRDSELEKIYKKDEKYYMALGIITLVTLLCFFAYSGFKELLN